MQTFKFNSNLSDAAKAIAAELTRQFRANGKDNDFDGTEVRENSNGEYVAVVIETDWANVEEPDTFEHEFVLELGADSDFEADLSLSY